MHYDPWRTNGPTTQRHILEYSQSSGTLLREPQISKTSIYPQDYIVPQTRVLHFE